ncbi:SPOR domain-containing protein [Bdellovibrio svalbardensis]|uniref:SPOR domain-containing protein n=1 Tax=Bdellovibrio svalbardensis TaxID=2972972 RepID=A0ABT6DEY7_9BACT|nr:SPOR domain-containing protein [Bdellovibrio svalbardensis]MDG0815408.1 SPOR domain-containing protein [Bdellovibrio svalbardensis]
MAAKTDVVVKLVLVFFISLLSFSIGTFVGKKYSDNQHQLSQLEPQKAEKADREVASVEEGTEGEKKSSGTMTDAEIAKLAEEFVADETTPSTETAKTEEGGHKVEASHNEAAVAEHKEEKADAHKPAPATPHGKDKATPVTKHAEPSPAAKEIAAGKVPTATEHTTAATTKEARVPSSLPKDVAAYTVGKFTVQVASYADEAEAQKFASDLKDKGYSAFYVPANIKGKTWFRVSVGQFATPKEAASYRAELLGKAKVNSAIVQKITE